jgi:MoxR-like ATPase
MQEKSVSVGKITHKLEEPFFVMATQNPIELEGTYPLPEAQMDRFLFKLKIVYPTSDEMHEIMNRTTQVEEPQVKAPRRVKPDAEDGAMVPIMNRSRLPSARLSRRSQRAPVASSDQQVRPVASPRDPGSRLEGSVQGSTMRPGLGGSSAPSPTPRFATACS